MKKALVLLVIALITVGAVFAAGSKEALPDTKKSEGVMTYAQYVAADLDSEVVIEAYIQDCQIYSAWGNTSIYLQDADGAYFVYRYTCSDAEYAKLVKGTKVKVTGYKSEWAGEVEITDAKVEVLSGSWLAKAEDVTSLLGTDALKEKNNKKVAIKGLEVTKAPMYNWDGSGEKGNDVYFGITNGTFASQFLVESDLCTQDSDAYKAAEGLKVGDKIDIEGYLYWYNGPQPHITSITVK